VQKNIIVNADCVDYMRTEMPNGVVDLAFADPPFNIGFAYDVYRDSKSDVDFVTWCGEWMRQVYRVLKPTGTFWLAIGDEYAAELCVLAKQIGFVRRSWVIWYYTFGVNIPKNFSRSHTHLFYFVKDPNNFVFNDDEPACKVQSKRQLIYRDTRANPYGRLPDNTWSFYDSAWTFPRIAGTHKQRNDAEHGCQMPERILERIIVATSRLGDLVFDPFGGSGTTPAVAKKLGRNFLATELSEKYCVGIDERLAQIQPGKTPIVGDEELYCVKREHIKGQ